MVANPYQIRILYEPGKLNIWLDGKVVLANYSINLAGGGISSSTGMSRIYLTSRTGSRFENHDILSWSFNALDAGESPESAWMEIGRRGPRIVIFLMLWKEFFIPIL